MMEILSEGAERLGITLTPAQIELFETYYRELVDWNQRFNLTAITSYEEVQAKHFVDSLSVIPALKELFPLLNEAAGRRPHPNPLPEGEGTARFASHPSTLDSRLSPLHPHPSTLRVVDIGAGAGMPGLPLKIVLPEIRLVLVESTAKKVGFLRHLVQTLGLDGVAVEAGRAEDLAHRTDLRESFDLCLARAVAGLPALAELALPFAKNGGFFVAYKGPDIEGEVRAATKALRLLGGRLREKRRIEIEHILSPRNLVIIEKVERTPAGYPRKPGQPAKHPL